MTLIAAETVAKRLGLLLELVPTASDIGVLANLAAQRYSIATLWPSTQTKVTSDNHVWEDQIR